MKNVVILSILGNVRIENIPDNMRRKIVIELARKTIASYGKELKKDVQINYLVNDQIGKYIKKNGDIELISTVDFKESYDY